MSSLIKDFVHASYDLRTIPNLRACLEHLGFRGAFGFIQVWIGPPVGSEASIGAGASSSQDYMVLAP